MEMKLKRFGIDLTTMIDKYLPEMMVITAFLIYHLFIRIDFGDDVVYYQGVLQRYGMSFALYRYQSWTSRVIIELIISVIIHARWLWRVLEVIMTGVLFRDFCKIGRVQEITHRLILASLFILYPIWDMASAGWIATTVNYWWIICALVHVVYKWIDIVLYKKKLALGDYIVFCACALLSVNHEQGLALLLGLSIIAAIYDFIINHRYHLFTKIVQIISVLSMIFMMLCPGNKIRLSSEIDNWFPEWTQFGTSEKIYLGIYKIYKTFLVNRTWFFFLFSLLIAVVVFEHVKSVSCRVISGIGVLLCVPYMFPDFMENAFPKIELFFIDLGKTHIINWHKMGTYCPLIILSLFVVVELISLAALEEYFGLWEILSIVIVFMAGLCSNVVIGFSPTVWASLDRTSVFFYFCLIYCMISIIRKIESRKMLGGICAIVLALAFFNFFSSLARMID